MLIGRTTIGFTEKKISKNAVFAMVLGGILLIAHLVLFILSIGYEGHLPLAGGVAESYLLLFSLFGTFWAILSYDDEKTLNKYKAIGILLNGIAFIFAIFVMAVGFMAYEI
jgi:hypothetical protein